MERYDPAFGGQREHTPLFLKVHDPVIPPSRPTSASHFPSTGRSTPPRSIACSIACQDRSRKAAAVANVAAALAPTGVLFGASILGPSGRCTWLSRSILEANNRRGTFDNPGDTEEGFGEILEASFEMVELETVGSMAIFAATNPRTKPSIGTTTFGSVIP